MSGNSDNNNKVKNHYKGRSFNPFRDFYVYVDTKEYLADHIFLKNNLTSIKFKQHFGSETYKDIIIVFCTIRKKDRKKFIRSMEELYNKIILCSDKDMYEKICKELMPILNNEEDINNDNRNS